MLVSYDIPANSNVSYTTGRGNKILDGTAPLNKRVHSISNSSTKWIGYTFSHSDLVIRIITIKFKNSDDPVEVFPVKMNSEAPHLVGGKGFIGWSKIFCRWRIGKCSANWLNLQPSPTSAIPPNRDDFYLWKNRRSGGEVMMEIITEAHANFPRRNGYGIHRLENWLLNQPNHKPYTISAGKCVKTWNRQTWSAQPAVSFTIGIIRRFENKSHICSKGKNIESWNDWVSILKATSLQTDVKALFENLGLATAGEETVDEQTCNLKSSDKAENVNLRCLILRCDGRRATKWIGIYCLGLPAERVPQKRASDKEVVIPNKD